MKNFDLSLYLVLDPDLCAGLGMLETTRMAVAGGATMVQLRSKDATTSERIDLGRALKSALAGTGAKLIVNDDIEAALAIGADGLHVGQTDLPATTARERIGRSMILGLSVGTELLAAGIDADIVDYAGVGPIFATSTKPDHQPPMGFDGLRAMTKLCPVPVVAIGGLKEAHVADVLLAGADGLAVVSAICGTPDPERSTRAIGKAIADARREAPR